MDGCYMYTDDCSVVGWKAAVNDGCCAGVGKCLILFRDENYVSTLSANKKIGSKKILTWF